MKPRLHIFAVCLLAITLLAGSVFHYPFYLFALGQVKEEIQRELLGEIEADEVTTLTFTAAEFKKYRVDEKELRIGEHWYDIISATSENGKVTVKCFSDKHESVLHAWLEKSMKEQGAPARGKNAKRTVPSFSAYELPALAVFSCSPEVVYSVPATSPATDELQNGFVSIPEVPPRA